ncbi:MAG: metallophosphoesterase [Verrucomicrobiota bacterium]
MILPTILRKKLIALTVFAVCMLSASALPAKDETPSITVSEKQQPFSFVQMCDTQLGMGGYEHDVQTFKAAVKQINALKADFVVICGDLVNKADDKSFADFNSIKKDFVLPCYCAPGNHDVENQATAESLRIYREKIGKDYYSIEHKGYTVVVANTQLWKAPVKDESQKHDAWFTQTLIDAKRKKSPVIIVVHYPLFVTTPDEAEGYFNLPPAKRKQILDLCVENGVVAFLAGHTHKQITNEYKGIQLVNGETTSKNFDKRPMGFRLWTVDGNKNMKHQFVEVKGFRQPVVKQGEK